MRLSVYAQLCFSLQGKHESPFKLVPDLFVIGALSTALPATVVVSGSDNTWLLQRQKESRVGRKEMLRVLVRVFSGTVKE